MARRYSDKEMGLILQRALELPGETLGSDAEPPGISLEQIKEIGEEVGIDPHRIEVAAASLGQLTGGPRNPYAGIPLTVQFESLIDGIDPSGIPEHDFLDVIRRALGRQGVTTESAGSLEWKARDAFGGRYVSLSPTSDGSRLRILGNFRDGLFVFLGGLGMMSWAGLSLLLDAANLGSGATLVAAALVSLIPPRIAYRWWRKKEDASLSTLHQALHRFLASPGLPDSSQTPEGDE